MISRDVPKWIDVLGDVVENYNDTEHSGTGMKPNDMTPEIEKDYIKYKSLIANKIYERIADEGQPLWVRIRNKRNVFSKGSDKGFSHKVYEVEQGKFNGRVKVKGRDDWIAPRDYLEVNEPDEDGEKLTGDNRKMAKGKAKQARVIKKSGIDLVPELKRSSRVRKAPERLNL